VLRGPRPQQNGTCPETGLPDSIGEENLLWTYDVSGRGTPVIAGGRVYGLGYEELKGDLVEVLFCLDEKTGAKLWEHHETDFNSDIIYNRYAIGSPTIDPETGNVFALTAAGLINAFTADGEHLWQVSMSETLGRLSFPNGRTGAPLIVDDLVIIHFIFTSWGPMGPASDRFFAFDKHTGQVAWSSTPSGRPIDSSFSTPILQERDGKLLFYAGLGGGKIVCVDARTGDPQWRFPLATGGLNSSSLIYGDTLITINGKENFDSSTVGRMMSLRLDAKPDEEGNLAPSAEVWRNDLIAFTSSPVLVGDRIYQTDLVGELVCVDAKTGEKLWAVKLGPDQLHASPLYADGKLYIPLNNGTFHIIRPTEEGGEILDQEQLEGNCLGSPAIANGRIYVHTTEKLYCFGTGEGEAPPWPRREEVAAGAPTRLRLLPADVTFRVGDTVPFRVCSLDASGRVVGDVQPNEFDVPRGFSMTTAVRAWSAEQPGTGVFTATMDGMTGKARLRAVPALPFAENFEDFELNQGGDSPFARPPSYWLSAGPKWRVVSKDGNKVIERVMKVPLFQRAQSLFGHPDDSSYTLQADMMTDGGRRSLSSPGLVNQRYLFELKGNYHELEVTSNDWRVKQSVPFKIKAGTWYTMKTRVDVAADGSGIVRAKVWKRDEPEPDAWTIEVPHANAHTHGAAGVFGFTPQSRHTVYLDNISVTPND